MLPDTLGQFRQVGSHDGDALCVDCAQQSVLHDANLQADTRLVTALTGLHWYETGAEAHLAKVVGPPQQLKLWHDWLTATCKRPCANSSPDRPQPPPAAPARLTVSSASRPRPRLR